MTDKDLLTRITVSPKVMVGKPAIAGTRLTVDYILNRMGHGANTAELLTEYPGLTEADVQACLLFASKSLESTTFLPLVGQPN